MKGILEKEFGKGYGSPRRVLIDEEVFCSDFRLQDKKSCFGCGDSDVCNHDICQVSSCEDVHVIDFEKFVGSFRRIVGRRCDILLYGKDKVALTELACVDVRFLEHGHYGRDNVGKAVHAYRQLSDSLELLARVPCIKDVLEKYSRKDCVFAYREKGAGRIGGVEGKVYDSVADFSSFDSISVGGGLSAEMKYGFRFIKIRYPEVYMW